MLNDKLQKELQRQEEYLNRLPDNFEFPLFNSKQALESQRRNGYRNTAAAAREIVDNALEAAAENIHIVFDYNKSEKGRTLVSSVAFIDDGSGMHPKMARYALSLGGGTHFDDPDFIGKFGFGLPNASINQALLVEVYTRTSKKHDIMKASLDVRRVKKYGLHSVEETVKSELPNFVTKYLDRNNIEFDHGTVVVWVNPDRLTYHKGATLKEHLLDDFGVTYRYLLDDVSIFVEGVKVERVDPLFLDKRGRYHLQESDGGAIQVMNRTIPVGYYYDQETDAYNLKKLEALDEQDPTLIATGGIQVKIARFPVGFAVHAKRDKLETDANRRFEVRKTRRGMSFVRAKREIETVDAFPRSVRDRSNGLGRWPLLQGYAYHWGVEVRFEPTLDEVFGITNDKQTVLPIRQHEFYTA